MWPEECTHVMYWMTIALLCRIDVSLVLPMYIESVPNRNSPPGILLCESRRKGRKVVKRTLLNLIS